MVSKLVRSLLKVSAVLFTSLVAPVLVNMIVQNGKKDEGAWSRCCEQNAPRQEQSERSSHSCPTAPVCSSLVEQAPQAGHPPVLFTPEITLIVAQGVGRKPAEASQNALRTALQTAVAAQVDHDTWARSGQILFEHILRNSEGLILGWKERSVSREWRLRGTVHHAEVAVEVNLSLLVQRLRTVTIVGMNGCPQGWRPAGVSAQAPALQIH